MSRRSSRVRRTNTQSNTQKYSGKWGLQGLVDCRGRNKVLCQYIKRRADPVPNSQESNKPQLVDQQGIWKGEETMMHVGLLFNMDLTAAVWDLATPSIENFSALNYGPVGAGPAVAMEFVACPTCAPPQPAIFTPAPEGWEPNRLKMIALNISGAAPYLAGDKITIGYTPTNDPKITSTDGIPADAFVTPQFTIAEIPP